MSFPEIPNFFFWSVLSGIVVVILIEILRPEILGFKDKVRANTKMISANTGVSPPL